MKPFPAKSDRSDQRYPVVVTVILTLLVFVVALYSLLDSRQSSYNLLAEQGRSFTEALAQASENAVVSETYYDYFVRARLSDLVVTLMNWGIEKIGEQQWTSFALGHDLLGAYVYDSLGNIVGGVTVRGGRPSPPDFIVAEVDALFADPESRFVLILDDGDGPGSAVHYYLELTARMDQVVVLSSEASLFQEALDETGIEKLARAMGSEPGVEYIAYQTVDGMVFSSRPTLSLSDIDGDPFLKAALDADSIVERQYTFQGHRVLEMVRPYSTPRHEFGLFRVGLSLERYYAVSRGYDQQLIILSAVLVVLLLVALAYLRGRRKRHEMIERFEHQAQRRERLSEMGSLAAGVAHEIRNPLNTISIAAQRLEKEFVPEANADQYRSFTQQIRSETKRLNETITRFLALAHEEKRQTGRIALDKLLAEVGSLLQVEGEKLRIAVSVQAEPGIEVEGDPDRLKEVFLNLFNNSKEALEGKPGTFEIAARRDGKQAVITVADSGPGIPFELHDKVFAPFYTTKEAGTGLGLPTVQRIITDMGGEVTLDTAVSRGTLFRLTIPAPQ
jgi:signal transduction histidine kinase